MEHKERNGHLTIYVLWPLCGGLMMGAVLGVAIGGLQLLGGKPVEDALRTGGRWALIVLAVTTVGVFVYALLGWAGPARLARLKQPRVEEVLEVQEQEEAPWIVQRPFKRLNPAPQLPAKLQVAAKSIEPPVRREITDLYRFITTMWPTNDITQANCRQHGFTRRYWDRFIGGSRAERDLGKESARGLLDRAGVIRKDGNAWVICAPLDQALQISDELWQYAQARARMIRL
jgi:hypothetical protein